MSIVRINSLGITDGTIVNADIATAAAIATTKLGAGAVLQVVTATDSTQRTTTSSTFVDVTGMSASITPSSTSNKVLIIVSTATRISVAGETSFYTIDRAGTNIGATNGFINNMIEGSSNATGIAITYLDSPSTTSSTTYKLQFKSSASATAVAQWNNTRGSIILMEIKA